MTIQEIVRSFYHGLAAKNDEWKRNLDSAIVFSDASGKLHAEGKDAFIQSFASFLKGVENVQVKLLITEGDYACAVL